MHVYPRSLTGFHARVEWKIAQDQARLVVRRHHHRAMSDTTVRDKLRLGAAKH